ncbi:hypothetical protein [Leifsonia sp. Leaf336]|uniref:hypothetical protein n=1 Tax=Leifsonia sp. Leaf336 TaxID=1736341 RepID=UPI0012F99249|nr:hypothetical protein [Leifsonia sp. Leaf336]
MDASWISAWLGLIGVVIGALAVSGTTLITEHFRRRNERSRDAAAREIIRRDNLRTTIVRVQNSVNAFALDKNNAERLRRAFDEATSSQVEFGLLVLNGDEAAANAVTNAVKAAMRATTAEQTSWISVVLADQLPRWYRGEITAEELNQTVGAITSKIPGTPRTQALP